MNKSVELISGPITFGAQGQRVFNHVDLPVVTNQVSVTFRLKLLSHNPNWTTIFHKGTDDKNLTPGIWMHGERMSAGFATSLVNYIKLTLLPSLSLNKWYHIAYVFSGPGNKLDLYIDGKIDGICYIPETVSFHDGPLYIGKAYSYDAVNGAISNFRYFNWCLSAKEVKDDFKGDKIKELLENNQQWSSENQNNKEFFDKLKKQEPKVLWFGCSDSRVPPELITKSGFGELFVHRNIANQFNPNDANCMSVLQYAVNYLKVSHIVICHTGCGGAKSCFEPGLEPDLEKWLEGIRGLATINPEFSHTNPNFGTPEVQDKLVKANVVKQVEKISKNYFVKSAEQTIQIHGLVFDLKDGLLLKVI
ncbi:16116_t:CDS:2 [Entrophospora sp. SA101]|nr:16116_t:CDS:2 [Entrophospora sp. SA101]CAJ0844773.1 6383_t:CDS:2 [Entrophospora sp. SA101]